MTATELASQVFDQPEPAGMRLAKGVRPGRVTPARDWHDVLPLDDRVALVIGQVPRQPTEDAAAAVVERLRGALTTQLLQGRGPAETVLALHRYAGYAPEAAGTTLCLAVFEPATRSLRCAAAGHPGVLVISESGWVRQLIGSRGGPLATGQPDLGRETVETVGRRETVLQYSIELGRCHPGTGLESVAAAVVAERGPDPRALCDRLADTPSCPPDAGDAVAFAFTPAGRPGGPFALSVPAEPGQLTVLRRELAAWLTASGVSKEDTFAFVLAVGEAAANSVEHGYHGGRDGGLVTVTAEAGGGGAIRVTVSDNGRWRYPPVTDHSRGRGLLIMRESMDEVLVHRGEHGTVVTLCKRPSRGSDGGRHDPGGYELRVARVGETVRVEVAGELPAASAPALRRGLLTAARGGVFPLQLDLSGVGGDVEGLVLALFSVADAAAAAGRPLVLAAPDPSPVRDAIATAGLHRIANVTDALEPTT
ncbi:ATP-binding protein [Allokutzneria albata]|uniref:Anti-sigma regulatory factor (Ser/Thr protein kinase) n=1 Tax=Allokutzneria albata TaxID=211114 RepID=A0A1G9WWB7_ALLAB|nr:ATP-binding protein [Allokutzneria albata]SDM88393.1 Anti-sigma regulatory factor (Ser/Thr protein kinase) [Allokutzneria albata]